jgi:hypothetical protein
VITESAPAASVNRMVGPRCLTCSRPPDVAYGNRTPTSEARGAMTSVFRHDRRYVTARRSAPTWPECRGGTEGREGRVPDGFFFSLFLFHSSKSGKKLPTLPTTLKTKPVIGLRRVSRLPAGPFCLPTGSLGGRGPTTGRESQGRVSPVSSGSSGRADPGMVIMTTPRTRYRRSGQSA